MPRAGFGYAPFGEDAFGYTDLAVEILWDSTPQINKLVAKPGSGGASLESLRRLQADSYNSRIFEKAIDLPLVRDPVHVRGPTTESAEITTTGDFTVTPASQSSDGFGFIEIEVSDPADLMPIEKGWLLKAANNRTIEVKSVSRVNATITLYGEDFPSGGPTFTLYAPSIIPALASDYGLDIDAYDYERFQRTLLLEPFRFFGLKGTKTGIEVRARASGFTATVLHLYRISAYWAALLPTADVFEIPSGSGAFYTSRPPTFPRLDDITADYLTGAGEPIADRPCFLFTSGVTWNITVTSTVDNGDGTWTLVTGDDIGMVANLGLWTVESASGTRSYIEAIDATLGEIVIMADEDPGAGVWTIEYNCPETYTCDYCPSHSVLLELQVTDPELATDMLALERAFERMVQKIRDILPIHVDIKATILHTAESAGVEIEASVLDEIL